VFDNSPSSRRPDHPILAGRPTPQGAHVINAYATIASLVALAQDRLKRDEKGATAVEYGLMVGLIAVVIIGAVSLLGGQLDDLFTSVSDSLPGGDAPAEG
jgi:pilus assembly protein Flp/PilA